MTNFLFYNFVTVNSQQSTVNSQQSTIILNFIWNYVYSIKLFSALSGSILIFYLNSFLENYFIGNSYIANSFLENFCLKKYFILLVNRGN